MAERPALEAVLFDAGGTLVRLDFEWMAEALRELGVPAEAGLLRRAEVEGRRRYDASRGRPATAGEPPPALGATGDIRAYFGAMVEALGGDAATVERALERFFARHQEHGLWTRAMEGAREAVDALAARGLRLAVVSNSDGRAADHLRDGGVLDGLEFVVDSHRVGVEKPDPRIFAIGLERLGVPPGRALFVGDLLSVDREGARRAGTRFVLLDPWGDYAPPGVEAIASIGELPAWVESRFALPGPRAAVPARRGEPR